jgi:hypothetical protein
MSVIPLESGALSLNPLGRMLAAATEAVGMEGAPKSFVATGL